MLLRRAINQMHSSSKLLSVSRLQRLSPSRSFASVSPSSPSFSSSFFSRSSGGPNSSHNHSSALWIAALASGISLSIAAAADYIYAQDGSKLLSPLSPPSGHSLYSFGSSLHGALGLGDDLSHPMPTLIHPFTSTTTGGAPIKQIVAQGNVAGALSEAGEVFTWGKGSSGALGHGEKSNVSQPKLVEGLAGKRITHLAMNETHSAAVETLPDGRTRVYLFGDRALGLPLAAANAAPVRGWRASVENPPKGNAQNSFSSLAPVEIASLQDKNIVSVACGKHHTLALSREGRVFAFGSDRFGALGLGPDTLQSDSPAVVQALQHEQIVQVSAGNGSSYFLTSNGNVYGCGSNEYGQGGQGSNTRKFPVPTLIRSLSNIVSIDAGVHHATAIDADGRVWGFGWNVNGQLGVGHRNLENRSPQIMQLPIVSTSATDSSPANTKTASNVPATVQTRAGFETSAIVASDGSLFMVGRGREGQLGRGDRIESVAAFRDRPVEVTYFKDKKLHVVQAATGGDFTLALVKEDVRQ